MKNYTGKNILKARLLYKFDTEKNNIHKYIDNHKRLLCVIKTVNKDIVAGYYPGELKKNVDLDEGGLIIALSKDKVFRLQEKKVNPARIFRGMVYDDFYVNFGNAELRIKTGKRELFSNLGNSLGYYDAQAQECKYDILIGEGKKHET